MLFKRKIYQKLVDWKNLSQGKTAVMIEGARRIGKSTIAEEFAKNEYQDYLILDFARESEDVKHLFTDSLGDMAGFFRRLFVFKGKSLPEREAIIILDEIQMFPDARQAIKYLVQDGRYDYLETGSLIRIRKTSKEILIPSEEERISMFPMDFEEFLWAQGDSYTYSVIEDAFRNRESLGAAMHRKIMSRFRDYMAVGGMPQAVRAFVDGGNYEQIDYMKRTILKLYEEDLKKYDDDNREKASIIFKAIPEQLSNHNSHYRLSTVDKNARYRDYVESVGLVAESMIGNECIGVTKPAVDLEAYADKSDFKLYMGDTGLLLTAMARYGDDTVDINDIYRAIISDHTGWDLGPVMENIVSQMLKCSGHDLYFHRFSYQPEGNNRPNPYELDFLTVRKKKVCPIEVKSSGYKRHASFDYFKEKYQLKMEDRFIIYSKDFKAEDSLMYIPVYMTGCI